MLSREETAIAINNLNVKYPASDIDALAGISFTVKKGSISVIIGPNGSGKSTLLQAIMGLIPYTGKIELDRKPGSIGYVPQRFSLDRSLPVSVRDFLTIPMRILANSNSKTDMVVQETLGHLQISNLKSKLMAQLSGGQFQRVLLARSLIHHPKILLLDEPEAGVDPHSEETFYDLLSHINKTHKTTILIASHELSMVSKYADQVICLNHKIVCVGDVKQSISEQVLSELYGYQKRKYQH